MLRAVLMTLLCACGPTVVAPELQADVEALQAAYAAVSGEALPLPPGATMIVDDARVMRLPNDSDELIVAGYWDPLTRELVMHSREWFAMKHLRASYLAVLAHEWGHALGLEHTKSGLMQADDGIECNGREGECMWEALNNKGSR